MNETASAALAILAILVPILGILTGALYKSLKDQQSLISERLTKIEDRHHEIDKQHSNWCVEHEDMMNENRRSIEQLEKSQYRINEKITEYKNYFFKLGIEAK